MRAFVHMSATCDLVLIGRKPSNTPMDPQIKPHSEKSLLLKDIFPCIDGSLDNTST